MEEIFRMKYKVGDEIQIKSDLHVGQVYTFQRDRKLRVDRHMVNHRGKTAVIKKVFPQHDLYVLDVDKCFSYWCEAMLEPLRKNRYKVKGGITYEV